MPLSSQVATQISWSPLNGLKGVRPSLQFGERTQDCGLGQAGKEGPHLARMGASQGFPRAAAPLGVFHEARRGSQGASRAVPGKSGLCARGEGERVMALTPIPLPPPQMAGALTPTHLPAPFPSPPEHLTLKKQQ